MTVIFKTGRFDNIDSAVIISTVSKVVNPERSLEDLILFCLAYTADDDS